MSHPACCPSPDTCPLSYREHLVGFAIGADALPTRGGVHRTPGLPDEPATATAAREKRWEKDLPAYKTLRKQGYQPAGVDGCHDLAQRATADHQVNGVPDFLDVA